MIMFQKELLPVISATVVASVLILLTGNSVAETATTAQATQKQLPPPGPFNLLTSWGSKSKVEVAKSVAAMSPPVQPEKPVEPQGAFNLLTSWGSTSKAKMTGSAAPVSPSVQLKKPVAPQGTFNLLTSWGSTSKMKTAPMSPPVQSEKKPKAPTGSFWSNWGAKSKAPVQSNKKPEAPKKIAMRQQAPAMPTANAMSHINNPTQPQHPMMPQGFNGQPQQMQQYQYIPLPVYRANLGYPVTPVYGGHVITPVFNRAIPQKPKAMSK